MNAYVVGGTYQQAVDWIRHQGWSKTPSVAAVSNPEYFFRGQENFIALFVGSFWDRSDSQDIYQVARVRSGALIVSRTGE